MTCILLWKIEKYKSFFRAAVQAFIFELGISHKIETGYNDRNYLKIRVSGIIVEQMNICSMS